MAAKKRAIEARVGHTQGLDDIGKGIVRIGEKYANKIKRGKVEINVRKQLRKNKVEPQWRQHFLDNKEMYLPPKKGTYANPYSGKALPKKIKKNVIKGAK